MSDASLSTDITTLPGTAVDAVDTQVVPTASMRPAERLSLSRERMRLYLETAPGGRRSVHLTDRARRSGWLATLRSHPAVAASIDAVSVWWSRHPLRFAAVLANGALRPTLNARARQRPAAAISLAVIAGAIAIWSRPWRWLFRPALFIGLLTQVAKRVVTEMPLESMLKVAGALSGTASAKKPASSRPIAERH